LAFDALLEKNDAPGKLEKRRYLFLIKAGVQQ
jgi:hypothetical protein